MNFKTYIENIPDYPNEGVTFRDITPLLAHGEAYQEAINQLAEFAKKKQADLIVGPEARGFVVGCPLAYHLGLGFIPARKKGKLPRKTVSKSFALEYGESTLQIHEDAIQPGERVLLVDDLLATGGTIEATKQLVEQLNGKIVGAAFMIELTALKGREKISDIDVYSLCQYND